MNTLHHLYRELGKTGIMVSPLGLGTVKFGRNTNVKYPIKFEIPRMQDLMTLIDYSHDIGINLIDTAPAYGCSEKRIGKLLHGKRNHWVICSKVGEFYTKNTSFFNFSQKTTRYSVEQSLRNLKTDYIDIILVHSNGDDIAILENSGIYETLSDLKSEGLILSYGFSSKTVKGGLLSLNQGDCVMVTYNLKEQDSLPVIQYAIAHKKGILIKKAFCSGFSFFNKEQDYIKNSFKFIFNNIGITTVVIGTTNIFHLSEHVYLVQSILDLD